MGQAKRAHRMMVAEGASYQVTERDRDGKIHWTHKTNGYATTVKRLANGNVGELVIRAPWRAVRTSRRVSMRTA